MPPRSPAPASLSTRGNCNRTQMREEPCLVNSSQKLLWLINRAGAVRLCDLYEREIGSIYPVVDISEVKQTLGSLYSGYEATNYSSRPPVPVVEALDNVVDGDINTFKLVVAITLLAEGGGRHTMGEAMCEEVQQQLVFPMGRLGELKDVENMALLSLSFYFMND
ncbi:hypothetical protein THARTR1_10463 [Trichoderma harzianum]|uniref:Uncharacterized protein n=1 Tax=Trichoderma harzianum TaxID=5544 RepID=A0A2K0TQH1_TRIHA|nr:hypothetical protein THARTR1_10463 [Trichoderma harzianum]